MSYGRGDTATTVGNFDDNTSSCAFLTLKYNVDIFLSISISMHM